MKTTSILSFLIMSQISFSSIANKNFVSVVASEHTKYDIVSGYVTEYGEWTVLSSTCVNDKEISDIYSGLTSIQTTTCTEYKERDVITKAIYSDTEKVISVEKETMNETLPSTTKEITGTHLERSCDDIVKNNYSNIDGVYKVGIDSDSFDVYCDVRGSDGWTLVGKTNTSNINSIDEPKNFFLGGLRTSDILSPKMFLNTGLSGLGIDKISKLNIKGISHFEVIQQFEEKSVSFFKEVNLNNLKTWFISNEITATKTCTDEALSSNCSVSKFSNGATYSLGGMNLSSHGYTSGGELHFRFNESSAPYYSSLCSVTGNYNSNNWGDTLEQHWGNGLLIYLK